MSQRRVPVGPRSGMRVRDLMTTDVITVQLEESVAHVRRLMKAKGIHCLPVLDDFSHLVGIVTSSDLMGSHPEEERARVSHVMSKQVHVLPKDADVTLLARVMGARRIHHVVVLEEGKVVGIVSSFDMLRLLTDENLDILTQARAGQARTRPAAASRPQEEAPRSERSEPPARKGPAPSARRAPRPKGPPPDRVSDPEFREEPPARPPRSTGGFDAGYDLDPADEEELGLEFLDSAQDVADPLQFGDGV